MVGMVFCFALQAADGADCPMLACCRCNHEQGERNGAVYGSYYSTFRLPGEPSIEIRSGDFVPFFNVATSQGIAVNLANTEFTVREAGAYWISFEVAGALGLDCGVQFFVNNTSVEEALIAVAQGRDSLSRISLILDLRAGDIINVRNVSDQFPSSILWNVVTTDQPPIVPAIAASLNIERLSR
jgi:hypothetical protein